MKGLRWAGGWGEEKIGEELGYYISSLILHQGSCLFFAGENERAEEEGWVRGGETGSAKSMHSDSIISHGASLGAQGALGGDIAGHGSLHSSSPPPRRKDSLEFHNLCMLL